MVRFVLLLLGLGMLAYPQHPEGVLTGRVLNSSALPVASAKVIIEKDGKEVASASTDADGRFRFSLTKGSYVIRIGELSKAVSIQNQKTVEAELVLDSLAFFDEPQFTVAGVTDNTYRGGHGSDANLRASETLTKETASLSKTGADIDPVATVQKMQKAAELDPSETNLFDWGTELLSHRATQASVEVFVQGKGLFPSSTRMILGLAAAYYAEGDYGKALPYFFQAADLNPADPAPYEFLFGARATQISQAAGYTERFARFVRLNRASANANYFYGVCLASTDQVQAMTYLNKAVAIDQQMARAHLELGILHAEQSRYTEAVGEYKKAVTANFDLAEAHYRLAEAYRVLGNRAGAEQETVTYKALSDKQAAEAEKERREVRQFVFALKNTPQ